VENPARLVRDFCGHVLMAQAEAILQSETRRRGEALMRHGPSEPAMREFDAIHDRI